MAEIEVFIPTAETRNRVAPLAHRLDHLAGKKVAWVDNQKANAHALLAGAAAALHKQTVKFRNFFPFQKCDPGSARCAHCPPENLRCRGACNRGLRLVYVVECP